MRNAVLLSLVVILSACGGAGSGSDTQGTPDPKATPAGLTVETGEFEVAVGDSFQCVYTDVTTDKELYVGDATGHQGPGGHHLISYYTDVKRAPSSGPCVDSDMLGWHQIAGASSGGEPVVAVPEGGAIRVPAGKQIVIQAHYINTTGKPFKASDSMTMHILDPASVKQTINYFAMVDDAFDVAPEASGKSVTTCALDQDLNVVLLLGHMHELGKHYKLELIDDGGATTQTLYDKDWQPSYQSHPPLLSYTLDAPFVLKKGSRLRQTCEWNNNTTDPLTFPREMCVAFAYYFPDNGFQQCTVTPEATP